MTTTTFPPNPSPAAVPSARLALRMMAGGEERLFELPLGATTVGSGPRCSLQLPRAGARSLHCVISRDASGVTVRRWSADTQLNGQTFAESPLKAGDCLSIGEIDLVATIPAAPEPTSPPSPETPDEAPPTAPRTREQAAGPESREPTGADAWSIESTPPAEPAPTNGLSKELSTSEPPTDGVDAPKPLPAVPAHLLQVASSDKGAPLDPFAAPSLIVGAAGEQPDEPFPIAALKGEPESPSQSPAQPTIDNADEPSDRTAERRELRRLASGRTRRLLGVVRQARTELSTAHAERISLQERQDQFEAERSGLESQIKALVEEVNASKSLASEIEGEADRLRSQLSAAEQEAERLRAEAEDAGRGLGELREEVESLRAQLAERDTAAASTREQIAELEAAVCALQEASATSQECAALATPAESPMEPVVGEADVEDVVGQPIENTEESGGASPPWPTFVADADPAASDDAPDLWSSESDAAPYEPSQDLWGETPAAEGAGAPSGDEPLGGNDAAAPLDEPSTATDAADLWDIESLAKGQDEPAADEPPVDASSVEAWMSSFTNSIDNPAESPAEAPTPAAPQTAVPTGHAGPADPQAELTEAGLPAPEAPGADAVGTESSLEPPTAEVDATAPEDLGTPDADPTGTEEEDEAAPATDWLSMVAPSELTPETPAVEAVAETADTAAEPIVGGASGADLRGESDPTEQSTTAPEATEDETPALRAVMDEIFSSEESTETTPQTDDGAEPDTEAAEPQTADDLILAEQPKGGAPASFLDKYAEMLPPDEPATPAPAYEPPPEPASAGGASSEDDSLEDYMADLMKRIRGDQGEPAAAAAPAAPKQAAAAPAAASPATQTVEAPAPAEEPKADPITSLDDLRRGPAPEHKHDMSALRDLANNSARSAIGAAVSKQNHEKAIANVAISGIAMACGAYLAATSSSLVSGQFFGGLAGFGWAAYWGWKTLRHILAASRATAQAKAPREPVGLPIDREPSAPTAG